MLTTKHRKRAKTDDEKEQRRVERVLRNRRAAQSSRERKRLEVEALEDRNKILENALLQARQANLALMEQVHNLQRNSGVAPTPFRASPTFSQELFSSQDGHSGSLDRTQAFDQLLSSVSDNTVNPASLSPALTPVPEGEEDEEDDEDDEDDDEEAIPSAALVAAPATTAATTTTASPDATHPAVMCTDLQCRSAEAPRWLAASRQLPQPALALYWQLQLLLISTSTMLSLCQRPLMQIAMSLRAGYSLPPTRAILTTIIWLVTTPASSPSRNRGAPTTSTSSTSTNSSTTSSTSSRPAAQPPTRLSSTLRLKSLRKILTSSPILARPLTDATMAVLRLVSSEGRDVSTGFDGEATSSAAATGAQARCWPEGAPLPSAEVLLTLLWAIRVEERRMEIRQRIPSEPKRRSVPTHDVNRQMISLKDLLPKRRREAGAQHHFAGVTDLKRRRLG